MHRGRVQSEESLRPPERSRLLDESHSFQWLLKTVCIPGSPQHCTLLQIGIADLEAVDFISLDASGHSSPPRTSTPIGIFVLHLNFHSSFKNRLSRDIFTGKQPDTHRERGLGTELRLEVRNVSLNLNVVLWDERVKWHLSLVFVSLTVLLLKRLFIYYNTSNVCTDWFLLTLLLQVKNPLLAIPKASKTDALLRIHGKRLFIRLWEHVVLSLPQVMIVVSFQGYNKQ